MQEITRRHRQVANAIRGELVTILRKDISDPRLEAAGMVTISGIDIAEDMRNATVWVSFMGLPADSKKVKEALAALASASRFIHRLLIKRIPIKVHPHLLFKFDPIFDRAATVGEALHEAAEVEKRTLEIRGSEPAVPPAEEEPDEK